MAKIDWDKWTMEAFTWVMAGIAMNFGLYALGLVGITFSTLFGSIVLMIVPVYIILFGVRNQLNQSISIIKEKSEEEE